MGHKVRLYVSIIVALIIIFSAYIYRLQKDGMEGDTIIDVKVSSEKETHEHASLLIFIEEDRYSLDLPTYMERADDLHLHDNDGTVLHIHKDGANLVNFFNSINMELKSDCFISSTKSYCTSASSTLSIFVNDKLVNNSIDSYLVKNGDKILINYGDDTVNEMRLKLNALNSLDTFK